MPPLFADARLLLRADALYQSKINLSSNPIRDNIPANANVLETPDYWTINSRIALTDLRFGSIGGEIALWGKNLTDRKDATTVLYTPLATSASYVSARTYGLDVMFDF